MDREKFIERQALLAELKEMMCAIGESRNAASWPYDAEHNIRNWVDAGDPNAPPPFLDGHGVITPEFFNRLRELRRLCSGWLYYVNDIVFLTDAEWQRVCDEQEAARQAENVAREKEKADRAEARAKATRVFRVTSERIAKPEK